MGELTEKLTVKSPSWVLTLTNTVGLKYGEGAVLYVEAFISGNLWGMLRIQRGQNQNNITSFHIPVDPIWKTEARYKMPFGTYATLRKFQEGKCAICRKSRKLTVDHNHKTGEVRGLLCNQCNISLSDAGIEWLNNAKAYLTNPPSREI